MATILAADDSVAIRKVLEALLTGMGHEVVLANDGQEAIDFARENVVDLVITDLNMPIKGGMSVVNTLRQWDTYKHVPILVLTTETGDYKKKKARSLGASGWISKPITEERLQKAIKATLG